MEKRKVETMLEFEQLINYYLSNDLPFSLLEEEYELSLKQRGFMLNRILDYAGKLDELEDTFTSDISDAYLKLPHNLEEKTPLSHDELMSLFVERKRIKDCILDIQKQVDVSMYQELLSEFNTKEIEIADYLCNHIDFSDIENFSKDRKSLKYYEDLYNKYNLIKHDQENYIRLQLKDNQEYLNLMDQAATVDEEIVKRNIKLANWVIRLYFKRMPFEMEEAQGYALEGLMRAINGFDVSRGNHFSTYASLVIKRTIQKHFKDLVGISWRNYLLGLEYKRCVLEYQNATLNDNPTIEDLYNSNLFGMSMTELSVRKKYADIVTIPFTYLLPLDPLDMRDKRHDLLKTMEDYLEQDNYEDAYNTTLSLATPADEVGIYAENKILQEALQSLILTLPDEEAKIIKKRYGFDDGVFNSMDKVALEFNISKDKVYRVDKKVQRLLRHPLQAKLLRDFYLEKDLYEGNSNTYRGL